MPNKSDGNDKPKVEDLLRLKRAERPDPEFWASFDRELEKKIVRSVVRKDPPLSAGVRWVASNRLATAALVCVAGLAAWLSPAAFPGDSGAPAALVAGSTGAAETAMPDDAPDAAPDDAEVPDLAVSERSFVIEVLSSERGSRASTGLAFTGRSSGEGPGAYYVADQLSSAETGWSGERLPF